MRNYLKALCMLAVVVCLGGVISSCGENEDHDPNDVKSVNVEYSVDLGNTWFDYYDIVVTYYDANGKEKSETITEKWEYGFSVKPEKAPKSYVMKVVGTPKQNLPALDKLQYVLSENIQAKFYGVRYDGSVYKELWSDLHPVDLTWNDTYTLSDSQMKDFLDGGVRTLADFTHSFDGDY